MELLDAIHTRRTVRQFQTRLTCPLSEDVEAGLSVGAAIQNLLLVAHEWGLGARRPRRGTPGASTWPTR